MVIKKYNLSSCNNQKVTVLTIENVTPECNNCLILLKSISRNVNTFVMPTKMFLWHQVSELLKY